MKSIITSAEFNRIKRYDMRYECLQAGKHLFKDFMQQFDTNAIPQTDKTVFHREEAIAYFYKIKHDALISAKILRNKGYFAAIAKDLNPVGGKWVVFTDHHF